MSEGEEVNIIQEIISWEKFKDRVRVDVNHSATVRKQCASLGIVLTVHLPYESLKRWGDIDKKASLFPSGSCSYVEMLNTFLYPNCGHRVKPKCQRVEKRLRVACGEIKGKFVGKNGTAYRRLCNKDLRLALRFNELVTVDAIESHLATEQQKCEDIENTNHELQKSLSEAVLARDSKTEELDKATRKVEELLSENKCLISILKTVGRRSLTYRNDSNAGNCHS